MKYKKGLIFICLIICLFGIASVCAGKANDATIGIDDSSQIRTTQINEITDEKLHN